MPTEVSEQEQGNEMSGAESNDPMPLKFEIGLTRKGPGLQLHRTHRSPNKIDFFMKDVN